MTQDFIIRLLIWAGIGIGFLLVVVLMACNDKEWRDRE